MGVSDLVKRMLGKVSDAVGDFIDDCIRCDEDRIALRDKLFRKSI